MGNAQDAPAKPIRTGQVQNVPMNRSVWRSRGAWRVANKVAAGILGLTAAMAGAQSTDLHAMWDGRCQSCHGHAGSFARSTLSVAQGRLQGKHHRDDLEQFLRQHYLADSLVLPTMAMLAAQAAADPTYAAKCAGCHQSAAEFARQSLMMRDGKLVGRASGVPVADYLSRHGKLSAAERPQMVNTLTRVYREVGSPP